MSRFLDIAPLNPPYDLGTDEAGRSKVQFNIIAQKTPSETFAEELIKILTTAFPAVFFPTGANRNIFASTTAKIPSGSGPYISIIETGGTRGRRVQQIAGTAYEKPTALVVVRATEYKVARAMARVAYGALDVVRNQTVVP